MLTEEQLEIYGGVLVPVFQQLEQDIIADIARRVRKEERWTETAELQAEELRRLGWSPYRIRIEVMRRLQANKEYAAMVERNTLEAKAAQQAAIDEAREALREQAPELFETVGNMAFRNDLSLWEQAGQRLTRGGTVDRAVREMRKRATGDILNLTRTMGFSFPTGSVPARRAFTAALNSALTQAVSGTVSYQQACANAVRLLTQSGLRHIDYKNGVTRQIDTAVRNAVLTASAQLSGEIMQANIEESGVAYVQVSAHWGARDSHAVWQGKVYSLAEFCSVCGYGEPSNPDHIYSYNCRHTHYPYWPGISEPVEYPPEPGPFEADGKTYTYYQATQRQRAMERSIRAMKRDALAQDAMGDKGALAAAKIRLDEKTAAYKRFSAQVNMRPRLERTQVFGYDRGAAARASKEVRFQEFWKAISISQPKRAHAAERADYVQQVFRNAAKLSEADARILETIAERFSWTEVPTEAADIYTLAALTARTGDEFAMFARGNVKIIMHGAGANGMPWTLPKDLARRVFDEQLRWTGHSHPTTMDLRASKDDRKTLAVFKWQKKSTIVDLTGKTIPFTTNMFDDIYK